MTEQRSDKLDDAPRRVRLSRSKGWRMPPNTIKVDRTTKWGNPFVVGEHGTREECFQRFAYLLNGLICLGFGKDKDGVWHGDKQQAYHKHVTKNRHLLIGKNLACWCPANAKCHADILLDVAHKAKLDKADRRVTSTTVVPK